MCSLCVTCLCHVFFVTCSLGTSPHPPLLVPVLSFSLPNSPHRYYPNTPLDIHPQPSNRREGVTESLQGLASSQTPLDSSHAPSFPTSTIQCNWLQDNATSTRVI